jgi:hypothetical protein
VMDVSLAFSVSDVYHEDLVVFLRLFGFLLYLAFDMSMILILRSPLFMCIYTFPMI